MTLGASRRAWAWYVLLVLASLQDLALTILGLLTVPGAQELNALPRLAFEHGFTAALAVKLASVGIVLIVVLVLGKTPHARQLEALLAAAFVGFMGVNAWSLAQLARSHGWAG